MPKTEWTDDVENDLITLYTIKEAVRFMLHRRQRQADLEELARIVQATVQLRNRLKARLHQARKQQRHAGHR